MGKSARIFSTSKAGVVSRARGAAESCRAVAGRAFAAPFLAAVVIPLPPNFFRYRGFGWRARIRPKIGRWFLDARGSAPRRAFVLGLPACDRGIRWRTP